MTWTRETVRGELFQLFAQHTQTGTELTEASHLVADLGIDSLGLWEIVDDIETKFKLSIPEEALRDVNTMADVVATIEARLTKEGRLEG